MITKNEISTLNLSSTKKDFVQIWNELLEVAGKLSERWDPTSTNESDPGIVILKALTGIADKLNYNIDKNTLEAFMPTAAQEDSMRKLCDMLGYNIKYYRSAQTDVTIKYYNPEPTPDEESLMSGSGLEIPKFTVITNSDKDVSYFTLNPVPYYISAKNSTVVLSCMEGQLVKCDSINDNDVITANQISEDNRFYLPETQIAENGIFIYNVFNLGGAGLSDGTPWERVDNLNTQARGTRAFKFGFDSYEGRPYIEFPEDYSELFSDGIFIYYTRTRGVNGNVSPRTLTQLELPNGTGWDLVSAESFSVENISSATEGANIETIRQAYNNFKKTVGTFETLVTCRDYMNKIYSMISKSTGKPYVSNILVTDIRNDLNRAVTICSCDDAGIFYKETPLFDDVKTIEFNLALSSSTDEPAASPITIPLHTKRTAAIDHFDLIFYPFKSYNQIRSNVTDIRKVYDASFEYTDTNMSYIEAELDDNKTIAHKFKKPRTIKDKEPTSLADASSSGIIGDIISINNYLRLNATIATNSKITVEEGAILVDKIKIALANAFNMRELDFGEEIPFDSIVEVIENADARIRVASLNEPALYTTFTVLEGREGPTPKLAEYAVASDWLTAEVAETTGRFGDDLGRFDSVTAKKIYNKLAVRNVLAGRLPLFNYYETFKASFSEGVAYKKPEEIKSSDKPVGLLTPDKDNPVTIWTEGNAIFTGQFIDDKPIYTKTEPMYNSNTVTTVADNKISQIDTICELPVNEYGEITDVLLAAGETVKFRAPNFVTTKTYPAYVNYHLALNRELLAEAVPAEAISLFDILKETSEKPNGRWQEVLDYFEANYPDYKKKFTLSQKISAYQAGSAPETLPDGAILVKVENSTTSEADVAVDELLNKSGCVKLTDFKAKLAWLPNEDETVPSGNVPLDIELSLDTPFITSADILNVIKTKVNEAIAEKIKELPTTHAWTISFDFECVPFEAASLSKWEDFVRSCADSLENKRENTYQILDFVPAQEGSAILWRLYGEGYDLGKYVTKDTKKLLKFTSSYFGLLSDQYLKDIYLAKTLGKDAKPAFIENNEEYKLQDKEYLYIEYTPSTTTEDGATQTLAAITEIHGPGTILRPSGFEAGLMDSSVYDSLGNKPHKSVTFMPIDSSPIEVPMQRFNANEQVELREPAEVSITRDSFKGSDLFVYKNFNNCPELEASGNKVRSYTLKDGEYIFYTDSNKSELAYYTSGTQVVLEGNIHLPKCDIIDLATLFDYGPQEIPWKVLDFASKDAKIIFQEYQYITLGAGDTVNQLTLVSNQNQVDGTWKYCKDVKYCPAGATEQASLTAINLLASNEHGDGWEVSSTLELDVSANDAQTLRIAKDDNNIVKLKTSIKLSSTRVEGQSNPIQISPPEDSGSESVSFKTNLTCQTSGSTLKIKDVLVNPKKLSGFELKVFSADEPTIVETRPSKVVPYGELPGNDITKWAGTPVIKEAGELWYSVELEQIKTDQTKDENTGSKYDNALRLPVNILPNTYGVFCIYVDYSKDETTSIGSTWIEVVPGTDRKDITILNTPNGFVDPWIVAAAGSNNSDRLLLQSGINCICVNKTCKLFIKTSSSARGILLFDELRLVNCQQISYTVDGITATASTLGLNVDQLAYQQVSDDSSIINDEVRSKQQAKYVDDFHKNVEAFAKKELEEPVKHYEKLLEEKPKLTNLVQILEIVKKELSALSDRCSSLSDEEQSSLMTQLDTYKKVSATLHYEKALLKALEDGKDIDELEQQLIDLLKTFESQFNIGTSQQQLLKGLEELRAKVSVSLEQFLAEDGNTLNHFKSKGINDADILNKLHSASHEKVNAEYEARLVDLAARIERVVNSSERSVLSNTINSLQAALLADTRAQLLNKINQLSNAADSSELESLLDTAYSQASQAEHPALLQTLEQLREFFKAKDYESLIAELTLASDSGSDAYLSQLVEELSDLLALEDPSSSYSDFLDELSTLYSTVQSNIAKTETVSAIITGTLELRELALSAHESRLSVLLDSIAEYLSTLTNPDKESIAAAIAAAIANLQASQDSQVDEILSGLTEATSDYENAINLLDTESTSWDKLPFANELVEYIWAECSKQKLASGLDIILSDFSGYIKHLDTVGLESSCYSWPLSMDIFHDHDGNPIIDDASIQAFFKQIQSLARQSGQELASKNLIATISNTVPISLELSTAMENNTENLVIAELIGQLRVDGLAVREKQQLKQTLKAELMRAIQTDQQLISILASLLYCPTLFSFEAERPVEAADAFYKALHEELDSLANELSGKTTFDVLTSFSSEVLGTVSSTVDTNNNLLNYLVSLEKALEDIPKLFESVEPAKLVEYLKTNLFLSEDLCTTIEDFMSNASEDSKLLSHLFKIKNKNLAKIEGLDNLIIEVDDLYKYFKDPNNSVNSTLYQNVNALKINLNSLKEQPISLSEEDQKKLNLLARERQLLADIQAIDLDHDFYYTVPVENSLAIDFNESNAALNTLMNPLVNYNINNINNNFVISKLDIDYLDEGIKIARSSRLN